MDNLKTKTVKELKEVCDIAYMQGYSKFKKSQLLELAEKAENFTSSYKFFNFLKSINNGFYDYTENFTTKSGYKGTLYKLSNKISNDDKEKILSFNNTLLFVSQSEYAPELKSGCVFVAHLPIR